MWLKPLAIGELLQRELVIFWQRRMSVCLYSQPPLIYKYPECFNKYCLILTALTVCCYKLDGRRGQLEAIIAPFSFTSNSSAGIPKVHRRKAC